MPNPNNPTETEEQRRNRERRDREAEDFRKGAFNDDGTAKEPVAPLAPEPDTTKR